MVYLKHDPEQIKRMIVDINFEGGPERIAYGLACGAERSLHYESELSEKEDISVKMAIYGSED